MDNLKITMFLGVSLLPSTPINFGPCWVFFLPKNIRLLNIDIQK